jgi:hypothetical protein
VATSQTTLQRFFKDWGGHLAIAAAGAALGLVVVVLMGPEEPSPPTKIPSAEDRFIKPSVPQAKRELSSEPINPAAARALARIEPSSGADDRVQRSNNMAFRPVTGALRRVGADSNIAWKKFSVLALPIGNRPAIAVVIDDMGVDRKRTLRAINMQGPLTAAFLPYGRELLRQTRAARRSGHELLVHVPMEPENGEIAPGPNSVGTNMADQEILRRLDWALGRFAGYVGISNHMGSRFTADRRGMTTVLEEISKRGLLFLDSRTTRHTVAARMARDLGIPFAERHVFLDDDPNPAAIASQLKALERTALRDGYAVGIGHPRDNTLDALERWLPALAERGFALVPISTVVRYRMERK